MMGNISCERVYTLTTTIDVCAALDYFKHYMPLYRKLELRIWHDLKNGFVQNRSKYISSLIVLFGVTKRTVNSAFNNMNGRLKAQRALLKQQKQVLTNKIAAIDSAIVKLKNQINTLKQLVIKDVNNKELVRRYKCKKSRLFALQQKKLRYSNIIRDRKVSLCFGTKKLFKKQYNLKENEYRNHNQWLKDFRKARDSSIFYLGCATEIKGNQNFQLSYNEVEDKFSFKIRTEKYDVAVDKADKANYILLNNIDFKYKWLKELLKSMLQYSIPLTYRIRYRNNKYYLDIIFSVSWHYQEAHQNGCIGIDFNNGFLASVETDSKGNVVKVGRYNLKHHGCGTKARAEMEETISKIVREAMQKYKALAIEDLDFIKKKSSLIRKSNKGYSKMLHQLDYSRFKSCCENCCPRYGVELRKVNPAYSSQIGKQKYVFSRKLNVHTSAAYIIARRGQYFTDKLEKVL